MQPVRPTLFFVSVTADVTLKLADHAGEREVAAAALLGFRQGIKITERAVPI